MPLLENSVGSVGAVDVPRDNRGKPPDDDHVAVDILGLLLLFAQGGEKLVEALNE